MDYSEIFATLFNFCSTLPWINGTNSKDDESEEYRSLAAEILISFIKNIYSKVNKLLFSNL